jgi:hypothetical protein
MRRYGTYDTVTAAATKTVLALKGIGTTKGRLYDIRFGSSGTPTDQALNIMVLRSTAIDGDSSEQTPEKFDLSDPGALVKGRINYTSSEPTYGSVPLLQWSVNQQASVRWTVLPEEAIIVDDDASAGVGLQIQTLSGSAVAVEASFTHAE